MTRRGWLRVVMFMLNTEQEELEEHKQSLTMTKAQLATERGEGSACIFMELTLALAVGSLREIS